jgi:hypothetical protein
MSEVGTQGDAGEFLMYILQSCGVHADRENIDPTMAAVDAVLKSANKQIRIETVTDWTCFPCGFKSRKIGGMNELLLGFGNNSRDTTLAELLRRNLGQRKLIEKDCPVNLGHNQAYARESISHIPSTVLIRYKRTVPDESAGGLILLKKMNKVPSQHVIDLWDVLHSEVQEVLQDVPEGRNFAKLELVGIIRHFGEENGEYLPAHVHHISDYLNFSWPLYGIHKRSQWSMASPQ